MKFVLFYHSFVSCWNHGNAHFLRGIARELLRLGHEVHVYEPKDAWSKTNALRESGTSGLQAAAKTVPGIAWHEYDLASLDLDEALEKADVVVAHEWNDPELIARLGDFRTQGHFLLLFHDTHHRAVTAPDQIERFELDGYDAVLSFGAVLTEVYRRRGWGRRVFTWHEAADTALFKPHPEVARDADMIWIGNWGDDERARELDEFLLQPAAAAGLRLRLYGVRYPQRLLERFKMLGIEFGGWLPNHLAPLSFARARMTIHVPRRPYVESLPGIPTVRVFEALACGIPLISAPWNDSEGLFPGGCYISAANGETAAAAFRLVAADPAFAGEMAGRGLRAIRERHSCAHRARELLHILREIAGPVACGAQPFAAEEVPAP